MPPLWGRWRHNCYSTVMLDGRRCILVVTDKSSQYLWVEQSIGVFYTILYHQHVSELFVVTEIMNSLTRLTRSLPINLIVKYKTSQPAPNGGYRSDKNFKNIFLDENIGILKTILLILMDCSGEKPTILQMMAWCRVCIFQFNKAPATNAWLCQWFLKTLWPYLFAIVLICLAHYGN